MKKSMMLFILSAVFIRGLTGFAMDQRRNTPDHEDRSSYTMKHSAPADTFTHHMVVDGIRAEFQVMSLASMNMTDPEGATHHIMVKFFHDEMNHQIKESVGKIKVIGPDKKEQIVELKNYSGIFAANVTFDRNGKYGVICLVKIDGEKHVFKFWYPHGA